LPFHPFYFAMEDDELFPMPHSVVIPSYAAEGVEEEDDEDADFEDADDGDDEDLLSEPISLPLNPKPLPVATTSSIPCAPSAPSQRHTPPVAQGVVEAVTPGTAESGRGAGRGRGRGSARKSRGGSQAGTVRWSYHNWVRLVHAVTEDKDAFRQITQGFQRHELDSGINPWDKICAIYNDPEFKPLPHKVATQHPDLRAADPGIFVGKTNVPAGALMEKWKMFKTNLTRWQQNYEQSGNHDSDKADFAIIGTGLCLCVIR
jgi:hypothetical protein